MGKIKIEQIALPDIGEKTWREIDPAFGDLVLHEKRLRARYLSAPGYEEAIEVLYTATPGGGAGGTAYYVSYTIQL